MAVESITIMQGIIKKEMDTELDSVEGVNSRWAKQSAPFMDQSATKNKSKKAKSKSSIQIIPHFLVPSLDKQKYGRNLCWVNREERTFRISWKRSSHEKWNPEETAIFADWDRLKGRHFSTECESTSKQRFRSAILSNRRLKETLGERKKGVYRFFKILLPSEMKRKVRQGQLKDKEWKGKSRKDSDRWTPVNTSSSYSGDVRCCKSRAEDLRSILESLHGVNCPWIQDLKVKIERCSYYYGCSQDAFGCPSRIFGIPVVKEKETLPDWMFRLLHFPIRDVLPPPPAMNLARR